MVDFKFRYKITYIDGQTYDRKHILNVQVTEEEYKSIIQGVLQGIEIKDNPKIPDVISRMTETVEYVDRWTSINGASRTSPLKNPRKITSLEFFLPDDVYQRVRRMKMPLELVNFEKNGTLSQRWIICHHQQLFWRGDHTGFQRKEYQPRDVDGLFC